MSPKKNNYHHGDLRKTLLKTTAQMIISEGLEKVSIREVAKRCGVSRTAPYRHFKNKNDLMCAVAEDGFKQLKERYDQVARIDVTNPLDRLKNIAIAYVTFAIENPGYYKLMFGNEVINQDRPTQLLEAAATAYHVLILTIENCKLEKKIPHEATDSLANAAWAMVHGLATLIIDGQIQVVESESPTPTLLTDSKRIPPKEMDELIHYTIDKIINGIATKSD
ncbi:MAG: TetR/AcrR family transcriptional regulator [Deltaproteobacteria bacterium]|nr:TetR/AcrR family transcriptional regulator [Deltaproteobacteria bacterium]NNL77805.1 TetR/AcrR family transcriptional regulator [Desulfobacterales bacterium]